MLRRTLEAARKEAEAADEALDIVLGEGTPSRRSAYRRLDKALLHTAWHCVVTFPLDTGCLGHPQRGALRTIDRALLPAAVHSLGGGTGSGLGARILEALRTEMFRRNFILSVTVGPTVSGDTVLQSYNAALCLERLQRHSDAVALFRNSALIDSLGGEGAGGPGRGRGVELADVNSYIAAALLGCLLPVR